MPFPIVLLTSCISCPGAPAAPAASAVSKPQARTWVRIFCSYARYFYSSRLSFSTFPTTIESQLKYLPLEDAEKGDAYYRDFFYGKEHHNYIAVDSQV